MANHVIRKSAPTGVLPSCQGALRQHALAPLLDNPLFSNAEQLRANHFVYESKDVVRLTRWYANVLAEIARRQVAAAYQRGQATLQATLQRLCLGSFRGHRPHQFPPTLTWVPGPPYLTAPTAARAPSTAARPLASHPLTP